MDRIVVFQVMVASENEHRVVEVRVLLLKQLILPQLTVNKVVVQTLQAKRERENPI